MKLQKGDTVIWSNGRKILGTIVHLFYHEGIEHAVVKKPNKVLIVVVVSYNLLKYKT